MSAPLAPVRLRIPRCAQDASGAVLLAMLFALFMASMTAETQACPHGAAAGTASVAHEIKPITIATAAISLAKADIAPSARTCGADASHSNGAGCWHGCCSSCSAAVVVSEFVIPLEDIPLAHVLPRERHVAFAISDGHFRPPRLIA
jgi:hypothetical protein